MALFKALKFLNGQITEHSPNVDSIAAVSFVVGGVGGTTLSKSTLDTLTGGPTSDASTLHNHDSRYFTKGSFINASAGAGSASTPIETDARGKIDPSFYVQSDITHGNLSGLSADDHPQYFNTTRGDARYFPQTSFVNVSAGVSSAGAPVKLNAQGFIDSTMISSASSNHEQLSGLLGGASSDHYHFTGAEHTTLAGGSSDASSLHNHNTQYFTKAQVTASLALKADDAVVIKKDGSVAFTADQSLGGHKITSMADGSAATDAATKGQMDVANNLRVLKSGDTMSGTLSMGSHFITNLLDPINPQDAATKNYVDAARTGLNTKTPVQVATTTNIAALTGLLTIDGYTTIAGDRVLVKDQTTQSQNGIYVASAGAWSRASDMSTSIKEGDYVFVDLGTTWARSSWVVTSVDPMTVGTSAVVWTRYNAAGQLVSGAGISITGDTIAVAYGAGIANLPSGDVGIGLYTNSGLDLVDPATGLHSLAANAQLSVKLNGSTLSKGASGINVTAAGITPTELSASVAGSGLTGGAGSALSVVVGKGIQLLTNAVAVNVTGFAGAGLENDGANNLRIASTAAGSGLSINTTTGVFTVNTDNTSIDIAGGALEVKALGITNAKIAAAAVNAPKIDFGTGANQVSGTNIPLADSSNHFVTKNVEAALSELADNSYIQSYTSGEAFGIGDLLATRRDGSNTLKVYKASAANPDNIAPGTLLLGDVNFVAINDASRSGDDITVKFTNPGAANSALAVSVVGRDINVSLATNGSSAITSTAAQIVAAVNGSALASAIVIPSTSNGANIQTAQAKTNLAGGMDYSDNGRWKVIGMAMDAAGAAGVSVRVKKQGKIACSFVSAPAAGDIGKSVYLSINKGQAQVYFSPTSTGEGIVYLGELVSTTEIEFQRSAILRGVNG